MLGMGYNARNTLLLFYMCFRQEFSEELNNGKNKPNSASCDKDIHLTITDDVPQEHPGDYSNK